MAVSTQSGLKLGYEPQDIRGKSVLITGGTTGIGRATALLLASHGARILTFGRDDKQLQEALSDIKKAGGEVHGLTADASRIDGVQKVFQEFDRRFGSPDILINNAAQPGGGVLDTEPEDIEYILNSNLLGYMLFAREAVVRMKERGEGHIVNIGSMSADVREKGSSIYVASKAGIQAFSEALRKEVNELGIRVSLIEPGLVGTDLGDTSSEEQRRQQEQHEMLKAEDIAAAVYFCISQPKRSDVILMQVRPHKQII